MTKHKDLPEGVQVAIEILQNVPREMIHEFIEACQFSSKDEYEHWKEHVEKWYSK